VDLPVHDEVTKLIVSRRCLERPAIDGDSPVCENDQPSVTALEYHPEGLQGGKLGRPLSKAKYLTRPIVN
jgi:hypothetical protein